MSHISPTEHDIVVWRGCDMIIATVLQNVHYQIVGEDTVEEYPPGINDSNNKFNYYTDPAILANYTHAKIVFKKSWTKSKNQDTEFLLELTSIIGNFLDSDSENQQTLGISGKFSTILIGENNKGILFHIPNNLTKLFEFDQAVYSIEFYNNTDDKINKILYGSVIVMGERP